MKVAKKEAVFAIASLIDDNDIAQSAIIQDGVAPIVAKAVSEAAISTGVRKKKLKLSKIIKVKGCPKKVDKNDF